MIRLSVTSLLLVGCAADPVDYTGETRRYIVDDIRVPHTNAQAREYGLDLDGNSSVDNQLGMAISTLNGLGGELSTHAADMIAAGVLASSLEITADDFATDSTVAVRYLGSESAAAELVGGALVDGAFDTQHPGEAIAYLPVYGHADPSVLPMRNVRISLRPDGDGFVAKIGGGVDVQAALDAGYAGMIAMLEADPGSHLHLYRLLEYSPRDGRITRDEFARNRLVSALFYPDVTLGDDELLSIGFEVHLSRCDAGSCVTTPPDDTCFDRVQDGDETGVDCGGSCLPCAGGATCSADTDCQSNNCSGTCAAPSCSDGIANGFEVAIDCGGGCTGCAVGSDCIDGGDCASGRCEGGLCRQAL